jgi:riboflavin synthase
MREMHSIEETNLHVKPNLSKVYDMFTGLIQQIARVHSLKTVNCGVRLGISCAGWDTSVQLGESICTAGCCLTIVEYCEENDKTIISFDVVHETLRCTNLGELEVGEAVNIERSLRADSLLGGHFVQGHIDGIEEVLSVTEEGEGSLRIRCSKKTIDVDTVVQKGSITIDGVSLTIAADGIDWFEVALVPTTLLKTTLSNLTAGAKVHIETDILARTVVQVVRKMQEG